MKSNHNKISVIIPVYNEAANLPTFYKSLSEHISNLPYEFELIFIDDDSKDESELVLRKLAKSDSRVNILQLSRNFGKEAALSAGLNVASGDAVLTIDADMQMPPYLIGKFINRWEDGSEVVVGVFSTRSMSLFRSVGAKLFYRIMSTIAHAKMTPHATDYRLLDRQVVDAFNELNEHNRVTRGLIDWMGFKRSYVYFDQDPRLHGKPSYSVNKLIKLAVNSFTAFSFVPLKIAGYLGTFILIVSMPAGVFMYLDKFIFKTSFGVSIRGTAFIAVLTLFLVGVVLACIGLMSLYIAHIYDEVLGRPLYVVRRSPKLQSLESVDANE